MVVSSGLPEAMIAQWGTGKRGNVMYALYAKINDEHMIVQTQIVSCGFKGVGCTCGKEFRRITQHADAEAAQRILAVEIERHRAEVTGQCP